MGTDSTTEAVAETDVPTTSVYAYWKEFDLESVRSKLDEKGLAIAESQEVSVKSRKQLAERTKEFKKTLGPDIFKQLAPLLKAYQEEVDALTNRAKLGESAFLEVFKSLYEAPDPVPALGVGLKLASKAAELEAVAAKTAHELSEYKAESSQLKNQDLTVRRLEEQVRVLEAELGEKDADIQAARKAAAAEIEAHNVDEAKDRETRLVAELERAEAALEAMRRMHQSTQSQLFSVQEKGEEAAAAARAEAEYASVEVERAQERLELLAKERDTLLERMQASESNEASSSGQGQSNTAQHVEHVAALKEELRVQRDLSSRLQSELSFAIQNADSRQNAADATVAALQASLRATESHAAALEAELSGRPTQSDLENARQKIRVLSAIVHNTVGEADDDDESADDQQGTTERGVKVGTLEAALLSKNRHVEHQLTMARLEAADARGAAEASAARVSELEADIEQSRALVAKLEEDLIAAEQVAETAGGSLPHRDIGNSRPPATSRSSNEASSSLWDHSAPQTATTHTDATMVAVLSGQRDRLRARVQELESAAASAVQDLARAKSEVAAAKADNVALVERLRYVQGYGGKGSGGAAVADLEAGDGAVGRYMQEYEKNLNPFTDFKTREKEARRRALPIQDRAAYFVGSALVGGSKAARSAILVYAVVLHLVAFVVLAGFSHRHADKLEELETMCATLHHAGGAASLGGGGSSLGVGVLDPVMGGAVATAVHDAMNV